MSGLDISAAIVGLVVLVVTAAVAGTDERDPSMVWEGRIALGFAGLIYLGPIWLAQAVVTVVATVDSGGISPWWLWGWLFLAPLVGVSPEAIAVIGSLRRLRGNTSRVSPPASAFANVQFHADQAWAATKATPEWQLRRTPALPVTWPPPAGGPVVWFCYAERDDTPAVIEVAAPFARISSDGVAAPDVVRLSDAVVPWGPQGITPLAPEKLARSRRAGPLIEAVLHGDPDGHLARSLAEWRELNGCIAGHPLIAPRLPPR